MCELKNVMDFKDEKCSAVLKGCHNIKFTILGDILGLGSSVRTCSLFEVFIEYCNITFVNRCKTGLACL